MAPTTVVQCQGQDQSALVQVSPSGGAQLCPSACARPAPAVPSSSQQSGASTAYSLWSQESARVSNKPHTVLESDVSDDAATHKVMMNLQELGKAGHEVMVVLSQVKFSDYLNKPAFSTSTAPLPRPRTLSPTHPSSYQQGDVDVLVVHRLHGILIGELKSVGRPRAGYTPTPVQADADVAKVVVKAIKQLDKSEVMIQHLISDVAPGLTVWKTVFLPYVSGSQLQRVLTANPQLEQAVCRSLGAADAAQAIRLCCCCDQLQDPPVATGGVQGKKPVARWRLRELRRWWRHRMTGNVNYQLTDHIYLDILARFVGPATTVSVHCSTRPRVEVRTEGEAVQELGRRLARLVLTPHQLDLIIKDPPRVCFNGPPGTGKTLLLVLQGLKWLGQGHNVHVMSHKYSTLGVSYLIKYQLEMTLKATPAPAPAPAPGTVQLYHYDFINKEEDVSQALDDLTAAVQKDTLHVLLDEVDFDSRYPWGPRLTRFVDDLTAVVPHLYLWTAGIIYRDISPHLPPEAVTTPLRSAPVVVREVQKGLGIFEVHDYSTSGVPAPGDGLHVLELSHHGNGHAGRWPHECRQCGAEVAAELGRLGVGQAGNVTFRDVFVLTRSLKLREEETNDVGVVTSPASGVVRGLRDAGLPVCVLGGKTDRDRDRERWKRDVADIAVARRDWVTVAGFSAVSGLERKVVVMLPARDDKDDELGRQDEDVDALVRLLGHSRCTTHLITVTAPPPP